jgi:hypothetical protein
MNATYSLEVDDNRFARKIQETPNQSLVGNDGVNLTVDPDERSYLSTPDQYNAMTDRYLREIIDGCLKRTVAEISKPA